MAKKYIIEDIKIEFVDNITFKKAFKIAKRVLNKHNAENVYYYIESPQYSGIVNIDKVTKYKELLY